MLLNNLKLALRNLRNQKSFAVLNILGLAVGIAAVLLIFRIVHYELSFNKNFQNYERIVRIVTKDVGLDGEESYTRGMPLPSMSVVKSTVPQFAATSKIKEYWPTVLVPNPTGGPALKKFNMGQDKISFFVEPEFFQIFDFQWLAGEKNSALKEPNTLVLTRKMAEMCFGNWENALGQTLLIENDPMTVQGVVADAPVNCDLPLSLVVSYSTILGNKEKYEYHEDWGSTSSNDQMFGL
ncbi:MAG: ABC transporter permease, partial [Phycisphaerae bacterium]|nr:ABC transporter permease [Saprospiraceae bacterium]